MISSSPSPSPDYTRPSPKSPSRSRSKSPMDRGSWSDDGWEKGWKDGWEDWEGWGDEKEERWRTSTWKTKGRWDWEDERWRDERWRDERWRDGRGRRRDENGKSLTSGSAMVRQRLQLLQEQQGEPQSREEELAQKLAAMGQSRFKRLINRQEKAKAAEREKQEAFQQGQAYQQQLIWQQQQQLWQPQHWPQQWPQQWPAQGGITRVLFLFQSFHVHFLVGRWLWLWVWCQPSSCIPAFKTERPCHQSVQCSVPTFFCAVFIQSILFGRFSCWIWTQ